MTNTRQLKSRNQREGWYWGYGKLSKRHFRTDAKHMSLKHTNDRGSKSHEQN